MTGCPFCQRRRAGEYDPTGDPSVMRFEPLNPVTRGHQLFMPKLHLATPGDRPALAGLVFAQAVTYAAAQGKPHNLITSYGRPATQTVEHLHVHYVPRRRGDGLTLPWVGQK